MKKFFLFFFLIVNATVFFAQNKNGFDLDTSKMNVVLPLFLTELSASNLQELQRFSEVPTFLKDELNAICNFKIAEKTDINYQSDCLRYPSSPYRKVAYIGMNDAYLVMSYRLGGLVEQPHILIVKFKDKKIINIWSGQGFGTTKEKILMQLQKNNFAALNWI